MEKPVKQVKNKPARDKKGRLLPGNTANPNGRPPKDWSWSDLLQQVGEEIEPKTKKQFKELVSRRLWVECINGNIQAIKELMNRMDGLPSQALDVTSKGKQVVGFNYLPPAKDGKPNTDDPADA